MKKTYAAIAAVILMLLAVFAGDMLFGNHVDVLLSEESNPEHLTVNPIPPDLGYLKELGLEPFVSAVPVLMIDTDGQEIVREEKRPVTVAVFDNAEGKNDIQAVPNYVLRGKMKLRGSEGQEKNQYRLNFMKNKSDKERKFPLFGMAADSRWVLHGPFADRSLMRNYLMYTLSRETMEWAPDCRFFELFLNGKYEGVYLAVEPVSVSRDRLNLSKFSLISGESPCILLRDQVGTERLPLETYGNRHGHQLRMLDLQYPDPETVTETQVTRIIGDVSQFERALYSPGFTYAGVSYQEYADLRSFADYFILNEFAMNRDAGALSTYVYKDLNGKLKLCVWDFNRAFNNYRSELPADQWSGPQNTWLSRMLEDEEFISVVKERYAELRKTVLTEEHTDELLSAARAGLGEAADRNFLRWEQAFDTVMVQETVPGSRNPRNFEEAHSILRDTIGKRLSFMDQAVTALSAD